MKIGEKCVSAKSPELSTEQGTAMRRLAFILQHRRATAEDCQRALNLVLQNRTEDELQYLAEAAARLKIRDPGMNKVFDGICRRLSELRLLELQERTKASLAKADAALALARSRQEEL